MRLGPILSLLMAVALAGCGSAYAHNIFNESTQRVRAGLFMDGLRVCLHDLDTGGGFGSHGRCADERTCPDAGPFDYELRVVYADGRSDTLSTTSEACAIHFRVHDWDLEYTEV